MASNFALRNRSPIRRELPGAVDGVGTGTAVVTLPVGPTYLGVLLRCRIAGSAATRANIQAMLTQFRILLSGTPLATLSGKLLCSQVEFYRTGLIGDTGYLFIPFSRQWMRQTDAVLNPALGTQGESSFEIEITEDGASTIDDIDCIAIMDPVAEPLGAHMRFDLWTPSLPGAGEFIWTGLKTKRDPQEFLYALHIEVSTAADLTEITFEGDGIRIFDKVNQALLGRLYAEPLIPRTMQTAQNIITLDFCHRGFDGDAVPLVMDTAELRLNFANAPTVLRILAEIGTIKPTAAAAA